MDTSQETKLPILVTPLVSFKNSLLYDEIRTTLGQLLVLMRNRLSQHIHVFSKQSRKYKRATLGGEAIPVCSDSLVYTWAKGGNSAKRLQK